MDLPRHESLLTVNSFICMVNCVHVKINSMQNCLEVFFSSFYIILFFFQITAFTLFFFFFSNVLSSGWVWLCIPDGFGPVECWNAAGLCSGAHHSSLSLIWWRLSWESLRVGGILWIRSHLSKNTCSFMALKVLSLCLFLSLSHKPAIDHQATEAGTRDGHLIALACSGECFYMLLWNEEQGWTGIMRHVWHVTKKTW